MQLTLIACALISERKKFMYERFCPTDHIFTLLTRGSYSVTTEEQTFAVKPGEGMLFRKDVVYERHVIEPVTMFLFRYIADKPIFPADHIIFADTARISSTVSMLEYYNRFRQNYVSAAQDHLFRDLIQLCCFESESYITAPKLHDPVISDAVTLMQKNAHRTISIEWYATKAQLSYVQFYRRFKTAMEMSPKEYIIRLRIDRARHLLLEDSASVSEIAYACGFESEYYFSRCFKKEVGISPSDYRRSGT